MVVDDRVVNTVTMGPATDTLGSKYTPTPARASVFVLNPDFSVTKVATTTDQTHAAAPATTSTARPASRSSTPSRSPTRMATATGTFLDDLNALSLDVTDAQCDRAPVGEDADADGVVDGDTDANGLLNPGETYTYTCTLASLPDGDPTVNTVTVTGTVVERTRPPDTAGRHARRAERRPRPRSRTTDTATVSPVSAARSPCSSGACNCDVGVPVCDMTLPGTEFVLYTQRPDAAQRRHRRAADQRPGRQRHVRHARSCSSTTTTGSSRPRRPTASSCSPQPIKFHLTRTELTLDPATASSLITADSTTFTITVTDVPAAELPKAGGEGMLPYLGLGLLLVAGATTYYRVTSRPPIAPRRAM